MYCLLRTTLCSHSFIHLACNLCESHAAMWFQLFGIIGWIDWAAARANVHVAIPVGRKNTKGQTQSHRVGLRCQLLSGIQCATFT